MHTELIKRAREAEFFQDALRGLAAELPADDLELDGLLKEAAAGGEDLAFVNILWAALGANRKIQAHHLVAASEYLPNAGFLATASMRVEGDVAGALLEAVAQKALSWDRKAVALLMAGIWWKEHQTGDPPQELIPQARLLARSSREDPATQSVLLALADMFHADGLWSVLKMDGQDLDHEGAGKMRDLLVERAKAPVFHCVPASPPPRIISGYTVRRAVAEIGRNDPCPCGSGRKYKKCCLAKDQLRWERSSDVPGLTWEELDAQMEVHLTQDRLLNLRGPELARLDPTRVAVDLLPVLINRLLIYHDLESVVKLFEKLGVSAALTGHWDDALWYVTRSGQRPLLNRLLASRKDPPVEVADLPLGTRLVLANEDQDPVLRMIEAAASKALLRDDDVNPVTVAYDLLDSRYRALGILVARGAVAIADDLDALTLLDALLETRDKLNLPPEDPIEEMVDTWLSQVSHRENLDVKELAEAQNRLREKVEEVGRLKAKTAQLQHELDRHEKKVRARAPEPATPQTKPTRIESAPDAVTTELRQRVAALREELNQRHAERNQLRRELQKARTDIEQLREKPSPPSESDQNEEAAEENLLAAEEPVGNQPLRLPEFPRKFFETLEHLPKSVTRAALVLTGRLAAGEPSAFTGVKRIKAVRDIWRQRVAGDYRLLFRLRPEVLEIVALINRRDLEKKIKTL